MKANCIDAPNHISGLVEVYLSLPDQEERDQGGLPVINFRLDEMFLESVMIGARGQVNSIGAFFQINLFELLVECAEEVGSGLSSEQADITADWLESFALELRGRFPLKK